MHNAIKGLTAEAYVRVARNYESATEKDVLLVVGDRLERILDEKFEAMTKQLKEHAEKHGKVTVEFVSLAKVGAVVGTVVGGVVTGIIYVVKATKGM